MMHFFRNFTAKKDDMGLRFWLVAAALWAAVVAARADGAADGGVAGGFPGVWKAGEVVSDEAVAAAGLDRCFASERISDETFARMRGRSWREGCPLKRSQLRYLRLLHRNAEGRAQMGEMVVNATIAARVVDIFRRLYERGYRIGRMVLIDEYGGDDEAAMRDNNTSCFNFRFQTGSRSRVSKHGLGLAIDINPLYNPYVRRRRDGTFHVEPSTGRKYAFDRDRRTDIPCKIDRSDAAYRLFTAAGFRWGGAWRSVKDYQHFEL